VADRVAATPAGRPSGVELHRGGLAQADLRLVSSSTGAVVLKDYSDRPLWLRRTWGRWLCRREQAAYRALGERLGAPAWLPRFEGSRGPDAFAIEYRPGRPLSRSLADEVPPGFVDALDAAVHALHGAGIVHLDLSHRSNVLLDEAGQPVLLDFASAVCAPPGGLRHRLVVGLFGWLDRRAVRKWRRKLSQPAVVPARPPRTRSRPVG
jgi:RIO-like serine/threonine protein kinase